MNWLQVVNRIREGEGLHTEFKRGLLNFSAIGPALCAFANTDGGVLILGVDDAQNIVGVREDRERVQERLTSFLQTGCSSPVNAEIGRNVTPDNEWVHWVDVPRQRGFEPLRYNGRVWIRRARSSVEPSPTELQELYNSFGYVLTEERTIDAASSADIEVQQFKEYLRRLGFDIDENPQPSEFEDLRNRGVLAEFGGNSHATLYGVLAFGKTPQSYPQTRNFQVECAAYAGSDRASDVVQVANVTGRLDEQVTRAVGWIFGLGRYEVYAGLRRADSTILPIPAIREALVNAVVHRDYAITGSKVLLEVFDDRVNITSPGSLPNHLSVDSVRAGGFPRSRNESMANYMLTMGFMEQRGRGWPVMREAMRDFNGTEPSLLSEEVSRFVRVTFQLKNKIALD